MVMKGDKVNLSDISKAVSSQVNYEARLIMFTTLVLTNSGLIQILLLFNL